MINAQPKQFNVTSGAAELNNVRLAPSFILTIVGKYIA